MRRILALVAQAAISIVAIALILAYVDARRVAEALAAANLPFVVLAAFFYFLVNAVQSYRIRMVLAELKHRIGFAAAASANFAGMLASDFTPARSGYLLTALALSRNHGVPADKAFVSILGPQIFDFALKAIVGPLALLYVLSSLDVGTAGFASIILGALLIGAMILVIALLLFSKRFAKRLSVLGRLPFGGHLLSLIGGMQKNSHVVRRLVLPILLLLMLSWAFKALEWFFIGTALALPFSPLFYALLQPLITILQFVPAPTLAGMGLSEAGAAAVLAVYGVPAPAAVAFALLTRAMTALVDMLGIGEVLRAAKI
jgi:uncharacterized protein (TIRG00374 family)